MINSSIISTVVSGIFLAWVFMSAVYKSVFLVVLDAGFLTNLLLLSNVSNAASFFKLHLLLDKATLLSTVLAIICFAVIVVVHCKKKFYKRYSKDFVYRNKSQHERKINGSRRQERDSRPGTPPDQVYGSERGQHRFVLTFSHQRADKNRDFTPSPVLLERESLIFDT